MHLRQVVIHKAKDSRFHSHDRDHLPVDEWSNEESKCDTVFHFLKLELSLNVERAVCLHLSGVRSRKPARLIYVPAVNSQGGKIIRHLNACECTAQWFVTFFNTGRIVCSSETTKKEIGWRSIRHKN